LERRDGARELAALPHRGHAEGDQVALGQLRQDVGIDVLVEEGPRIVLEPETPGTPFGIKAGESSRPAKASQRRAPPDSGSRATRGGRRC
jgi:hypothetical protein